MIGWDDEHIFGNGLNHQPAERWTRERVNLNRKQQFQCLFFIFHVKTKGYIPNKHGKKHCTSGEHNNRFCWGWSLWTFDPWETFGLGEQAGASAGISQRQTSCFLWFVLLLDAQVLRSLEQFALHLVWSLQVTLVGAVPISQLFGETRWLVSSRCPPSSVAGMRESEYPVRRWLQKGLCDHSCCCNAKSNQ